MPLVTPVNALPSDTLPPFIVPKAPHWLNPVSRQQWHQAAFLTLLEALLVGGESHLQTSGRKRIVQ